MKLVVGVSGGADSLALLHLLTHAWPREYLVVAHLNHGLRDQAEADADFVRGFSAENKLTCEIGFTDVPLLVKRSGQTVEEAGRSARYHFLSQVAAKHQAQAILTAHHADDQAETVLMHILRGSGLGGLRGMSPIALVPNESASDVRLLRPLLTVTRAQIDAYCEAQQLTPIVDETNADTTYLRNWLRHELLPQLETYNPNIAQQLNQLGELATADESLLHNLALKTYQRLVRMRGDGWLQIARDAWLKLPLSLRRRTMRLAIRELADGQEVGFRALEQARLVAERGRVGQQSPLPGGLDLSVGYVDFSLAIIGVQKPHDVPQLLSAESMTVQVPGVTLLADGWRMVATWLSPSETPPVQSADALEATLAVPIENELVLRPRRAGERMRPLGMQGKSRKLKDIMIEEKIPQRLRERWPILVSAETPLWLVGHKIDESARVTSTTDPILHLKLLAPTAN